MEAFPYVAPSAGRDFRRPPPGGHFGCLGCVPRDAGPRVRGRGWRTGPRRRRRDRCLHLTEASVRLGRGTAGDDPHRGWDTNFQPAPGPAPPTGRDGGRHADGRGSGESALPRPHRLAPAECQSRGCRRRSGRAAQAPASGTVRRWEMGCRFW